MGMYLSSVLDTLKECMLHHRGNKDDKHFTAKPMILSVRFLVYDMTEGDGDLPKRIV